MAVIGLLATYVQFLGTVKNALILKVLASTCLFTFSVKIIRNNEKSYMKDFWSCKFSIFTHVKIVLIVTAVTN